jgi:ABC-type branched-subunit amino acid transport system ATPase component/ABC-type branched-subunit amino acid transport system permease subunit
MVALTFTVPFTHFDIPSEVVILGLITGLAYGLLALGLTLAYRIARVVNFAHGSIGALCALIVPVLVIQEGWPFWPSIVIALLAAMVVGVLIDVLVMRRLLSASRLVAMAATIAIANVLFILSSFLPQVGLGYHRYPLPFNVSIHVGTLTLHTPEVLTLITVPIIVVALMYLLQRTYLGLAIRFSSDNLEAAQLAGVPAPRVSTIAWVLVSLTAAVGAILTSLGQQAGGASPGTNQGVGPELLAVALAASMLGGLNKLPTVFGAGVMMGVAQSVLAWNTTQTGVFELFVFAVILVSLLVQKQLGRLARGVSESSWSLTGFLAPLDRTLANHRRVRTARRGLFAGLLVLAVLAPPALGVGRQAVLATVVIYAIIGLSSIVLTGFAGQISIGQFAFVGVAALVAGRLYVAGYPQWVTVLYGIGAGILLALAIGIPALRVRGIFLAVVTLAFGIMVSVYLPDAGWLVKSGATSTEVIPRSKLFGIALQNGRNYYWLCLGFLLLTALIVRRVQSTGIGRSMMAVRDNESAAEALSINPRTVKLTAFALSGAIASLGGFLYGGLVVNFTHSPELFFPGNSLTVLLMVILGGVTTVSGAIIGAVWIVGAPYLLGLQWGLLTSSIGVLLVLLYRPGGVITLLYDVRDRIAQRLVGPVTVPVAADEDEDDVKINEAVAPDAPAAITNGDGARRPAPSDPDDTPLVAEDIVVRFGGITAVNHVSMSARRGEILGLVGPNGAGKTTLFEVMSGAVKPDQGRVYFEGIDITKLPPEQRSQLGLGRTFQHARLFPDLTLKDAFKVALERDERSELFPSLVGLPPSRSAERRKDIRADEVLDQMGLTAWGSRPVSDLSTGLRRLAEIGCVLALNANVMLLDEPTAGLSQREAEAFVPQLRQIQATLESTVIVISHDVPMMVDLVDRLYVLVGGEVIAMGDPRLLQSDPRVIEAYLGTAAAAAADTNGSKGRKGRSRKTSAGGRGKKSESMADA